jgi:hypothetical protein
MHIKSLVLAGGSSLLAIYSFTAVQAFAGDDLAQALASSKWLVDSSLRTEDVRQAGFKLEAQAMTWRNRIALQTGDFYHFSALVEGENVYALQSAYNSTVNGKTQYPSVNDPSVTELHRAEIMWTPDQTTAVAVGRQRIVIDDGRFIGNSGWRQSDQVFDGLRFDTGTGPFRITTAYLSRIDRTTGDFKDWYSNSYIVNASYAFAPVLKVEGFDYALKFTSAATAPVAADLANARDSSVDITGGRATGTQKYADGSLGYVVQAARETNAEGNPHSFHLQETMAEINGGYHWLSGRINYESLGGNGVVGFVSPLASNHSFEGYADAFSATGGNKTFVDGIDDLNYTLTGTMPGPATPALSLIYHDFSTARLDERLGREWDIVATTALTSHLNLMLKSADYHSENTAGPASRTKQWIMLTYKR